ncbi:hypothetical protein BKK49_11695 [Rodentibacter rarus]|uniref:hypothetical protein n=1 Tax=Rodentibacter rarus TaxID=1908260 RepID=UPI0009841636|nr:hypothetical protein [Rodentibacter rarus]OOF36861.1 hypothetical protein BKK49_11695 [Rodentibacter rarus]
MKNYFSMDTYENPAEIRFHDTLEQAKAACLECANAAFDEACENGSFDETAFEFHNAVFGVVLGRAVIRTRPTTEEEKEHMIDDNTGKPFEAIALPPEIVE